MKKFRIVKTNREWFVLLHDTNIDAIITVVIQDAGHEKALVDALLIAGFAQLAGRDHRDEKSTW